MEWIIAVRTAGISAETYLHSKNTALTRTLTPPQEVVMNNDLIVRVFNLPN